MTDEELRDVGGTILRLEKERDAALARLKEAEGERMRERLTAREETWRVAAGHTPCGESCRYPATPDHHDDCRRGAFYGFAADAAAELRRMVTAQGQEAARIQRDASQLSPVDQGTGEGTP